MSLGLEVQLYRWWHAKVRKVVVVNTINIHSGNLRSQPIQACIHNHRGLHSIVGEIAI